MIEYLPAVTISILAILVGVTLLKWQNDVNNSFNLIHLLEGEDGKISLFRFGQATALAVSSWAFVILVQQGKLTEYYFYGYMGVWSGINLAKNLLGKATDANKT